jgi:hypothetical protein
MHLDGFESERREDERLKRKKRDKEDIRVGRKCVSWQ